MTEDHTWMFQPRLFVWFFIFSFILITPNVFGISPGPAVPQGNSTQSVYCADGICHTPNTPLSSVPTSSGPTLTLPAIHTNLIGIQLSETCLRMIQNNVTNTCLTYKQLKPLDTTNPLLAGKWTDKPYTHRLPPLVKNTYSFNDSTIVMVDPNLDFSTRARMLIVTDDNFTWVNKAEVSTNGGLTTHEFLNQYASLNCDEAKVPSDFNLVNETLHYLESGCTHSDYNNTVTITHPDIPWQWDNPFSSLHQQNYVKSVKATGGLSDCIHHKCTYTDPYKKQGW